ncbi:MAG: DUF6340 family protein [Bacteroidales bacterium]|nr:DUF6340 family protein [Bacteroidales bacterium]
MKTMMKCRFFFYYCLISLVFVSCASVHSVVIEVREPAKITLPLDIAEVIVVNNSAIQPSDVGIAQTYDEIAIKNNSLNTDMGPVVMQSLFNTLSGATFFNNVSSSRVSLRAHGDWMEEHPPIPLAIQEVLMDSLAFDGIISVDRVLLSLDEKVKDNMPLTSSSMSHYVDLKIEGKANGSIYSYNKKEPLYTFTVSDSIIIKDTYFEDSLTVIKHIPDAFIIDLARNLGSKLAQEMLPSWTPKERYFYTGTNARMKEAYSYTRSSNWKQAKEIWMKEYEQNTKAIDKGKMANNIAIASEMEDNLNESLSWAQKAQEYFIQANVKPGSEIMIRINTYIEDLKKRMEDNRLLNEQIGL